MEIRWSQLGSPTKAGTYSVSGVGDVSVTDADIEDAGRVGGDPWVEIELVDVFGNSPIKSYILGHFRPA